MMSKSRAEVNGRAVRTTCANVDDCLLVARGDCFQEIPVMGSSTAGQYNGLAVRRGKHAN